ncbi:NAD(P)-dependent oxidoreductase [Mesorhizobium sp. M2A.F.Ca.ET.037.01.1.1]|uniref:NAD-dependent epimerase/dehydratase family protein n=1 Tax=unclassified Mesorhizobium TaxID=325217 RepID=UPI000FCB9F41|nr:MULTISPECIES: NAD(P)-dependent oxidoreductase [unclassified Mesorhizobium]RUY10882.1 NAD(P)-dependent oxidoreductase [Mesorhizobium sp. M2A.F.Ca.ET.040.01.1.1]RUX23264.1 NAD(P)-dependent oxidoreductase [Mesorhizobium sp. M2A.F.Ca.ET.037.01.1.1]RWA92915.1 MAG: NAD(P)-dependent oxidoreductase [Mesorhizobium sp.]RWF37169.1 MAG: NAD(P)-dependent oxidoreductase [Mesorhizobium sp.]RWX72365.1 NAD-dependent epimerase/dehydratase family protein [Mesorhizobium sp. M2A.F.Ca.ET.039.01.1.1]
MRVGITGANGYVGTILRAAFAEQGHKVIAFARPNRVASESAASVAEWRPYEIKRPPSGAAFSDLDVLIHGAWDLTLVSAGDVWGTNVSGSQHLLRNVAAAGVRRVIFISSMSAYKGTQQLYGQAKLACERTAGSLGAVSTRLGLVYGPGWGGMAGALRKLTTLPVTPLIGAQSHQFMVHEADMAAAMVRIAESDMPLPEPVGLANPEPVPFRRLMNEIAASQGRTLRAVAVPWQLVSGALKAAEAVHVPLPFRSDSILGLVRPAREVPGVERLKQLGIEFRSFSVDGDRPSSGTLRRYA